MAGKTNASEQIEMGDFLLETLLPVAFTYIVTCCFVLRIRGIYIPTWTWIINRLIILQLRVACVQFASCWKQSKLHCANGVYAGVNDPVSFICW